MSGSGPDFTNYRALLAKVSEKFAEIQSRNHARMNCGRGCHACCAPDISVFEIEKEHIRTHIESTPGLEGALRRLEAENPHKGERCRFLGADGGCAIYEVRPLICRSHGAPIFAQLNGETLVDACPLNFQDLDSLAELSNGDFINIDLLNQILTTLNRQLGGDGRRWILSVDGMMGSSET